MRPKRRMMIVVEEGWQVYIPNLESVRCKISNRLHDLNANLLHYNLKITFNTA